MIRPIAGQNVASLESSNADCDVTVTESTAASATGLVFRLSNGTNHLLTNSQSNGQHLYKNVNGYTDLATGGTVELANGDTLKAVLSGSSVIIQLNGTQIISVTETTFQTNTKHGLRSNGATAVRFNNFKVEIAGGSLALTGVGGVIEATSKLDALGGRSITKKTRKRLRRGTGNTRKNMIIRGFTGKIIYKSVCDGKGIGRKETGNIAGNMGGAIT